MAAPTKPSTNGTTNSNGNGTRRRRRALVAARDTGEENGHASLDLDQPADPGARTEPVTQTETAARAAPAAQADPESAPPPRSIKGRLLALTGGVSTFPLFILFGLNAVDELDRTAFGVLTPEIRDHFGLSNQGIFGVVTAFSLPTLFLGLWIAHRADRSNRVVMARSGALAWAVFSVMTGAAPAIAVLILARIGSGVGRAVNDPTHNSLLADFYPPQARAKVYYAHRLANSAGQFIGPTLAGFLAAWFTWRTPFFLFAVPTVIFVVLSFRLKEPRRGYWDKVAAGDTEVAAEASADDQEESLPFKEAWRILWNVRSLRQVYFSLPFLSASLVGIGALSSVFWEDVYGLNSQSRGLLESLSEAFQIPGIILAGWWVQKILNHRPAQVMKLLAIASVFAAGALFLMAGSPVLIGSIIGRIIYAVIMVSLVPGIYAIGSLAIPAKVRALGFTASSIWGAPGILVLPFAGGIGDAYGLRVGMMVLIPVYLIGALILASSGRYVDADIARNRAMEASQAQLSRDRSAGVGNLLEVRGLDIAYGGTQVLFGVDFEVADGEIVALLGTNGAGKSTLLKGIAGLAKPVGGIVMFDGEDITAIDAVATTKRGIIQMPGGRGVFPSLTVQENLKAAGWLYKNDQKLIKERTEEAISYFPILRERWNTRAGDLSGGQQQMLSLSMAFIAQPKILMIDELTLGLAPTVVESLMHILRAIHSSGTAVVLVEQSVNVALQIAERAVFLEKGEVRFSGATKDLLERDDILRAVYLQGTQAQEDSDDDGDPDLHRERLAAKAARAALVRDNPVVLETREISKRYGGISAVESVSLSLHQDEILGLIGPNGAGKTTIMDLISGFQELNGGRVLLHGTDVTDWSASARGRAGLGRSFQDARLWPSLTVKENLAVALERQVEVPDTLHAMFHLPDARDSERAIFDRTEELIELMRVGAFRDKFIGELSTGSRRMVELAAVLAHRPTVLLLDEPSSGIAQRETEALGPVLRDVQRELQCSILIIEHDMPLLTDLADRILALDLGRYVTDGPAEEVLSHPHVVESYLGGAMDYGDLGL